MPLALKPPVAPQLARSQLDLPQGQQWIYEPKWDGFRAIVFVDGKPDQPLIQSRGGKDLRRYFPELEFPPGEYVLDGEIVIDDENGRQDFDALQNRIHPAVSRINLLAKETPAEFVAFDLLATAGESKLDLPFGERRKLLEDFIEKPIVLTPCVDNPKAAQKWLESAEGVIAKDVNAPYRPGERQGMFKIKRIRTIDCVVVGYRLGKEKNTVGSLILGLYDPRGELVVVGHSSGFTAKQKRELTEKLAPYETGARGSGDPSRWTGGRDLTWVELRPELVVEINFDHVSGQRIRHGAKITRWRTDKSPRECLIEQLSI